MRFAYFNPTVFAIEDVPSDVYVNLKNITDNAHTHKSLNDEGNPNISVRGGQQVQLVPNEFNLDTKIIKDFVESRCREFLANVMQTSGKQDLDPYDPVLISAWTIRQTSGDYQALHTHEAHISGNIYIDVPDLDDDAKVSDANIEFRLPVIRNPAHLIFTDQWRFKPQIMKMIIFPSYVPHVVYPWQGGGHRTILAWDARLMPKTG